MAVNIQNKIDVSPECDSGSIPDTDLLTNKFFSILSRRLYKEPHLSDITWALISSSSRFAELFINFFGFTDFDINRQWDIHREYPLDDGGRPDFFITQCDKTYVIENKINDKNYHFAQYCKACKNAQHGFISSYRLDINSLNAEDAFAIREHDIKLKTWDEFHDYLTKQLIDKSFPLAARNLFQAYLDYLRGVCSIMEINTISNIDDLSGLFNLSKLFTKCINNCGYREFDNKGRIGDDWIGKYFSVPIKDVEYLPMLAIEFGKIGKRSEIVIWVENKWANRKITSAYENIRDNSSYTRRREGNEYIEFTFAKRDEFNQSDKDRQEILLIEFIQSVIAAIEKAINN
jgi:hypothetical protein